MDLGITLVRSAGETSVSTAYAEGAVDLAQRIGEPALLAEALAVAGMVDFNAGRPGAQDRISRALALEDPDRPNLLFGCPSMLAAMVWMLTERQDQARAIFERRYHVALEGGEEGALTMSGFWGAYLACLTGDLDSAADYARTSLEASVHVGGDMYRATGLTAQAMVDAFRGDVEASRRRAREACALTSAPAGLVGQCELHGCSA